MKYHRTGEYREPKNGEWYEPPSGQAPLQRQYDAMNFARNWILRTTEEPPDAAYYARKNELTARAERAEARVKDLEFGIRSLVDCWGAWRIREMEDAISSLAAKLPKGESK